MMRRQQAARLRLAWLLWLMALPALVLASASCTRSSQAAAGGHEPTAVVIFVDFSDSVGGMDRTGFKREIDKLILPWLEPGDSFLIAPINDKTLTGFRPAGSRCRRPSRRSGSRHRPGPWPSTSLVESPGWASRRRRGQ